MSWVKHNARIVPADLWERLTTLVRDAQHYHNGKAETTGRPTGTRVL